MQYKNMKVLFARLREIPKPWNKNINTAIALLLLSIYMKTGNRAAFDAIINRKYTKVLDMLDEDHDTEAAAILGLTILVTLYPRDTFVMAYVLDPNNGGAIPTSAVEDTTRGIAYLDVLDRLPPNMDYSSTDPTLEYITYGDDITDLDGLIAAYPKISEQLLQRAVAPLSDFPTLLTDKYAIEDVYRLKRQKVIGFLKPIVDPSLHKGTHDLVVWGYRGSIPPTDELE